MISSSPSSAARKSAQSSLQGETRALKRDIALGMASNASPGASGVSSEGDPFLPPPSEIGTPDAIALHDRMEKLTGVRAHVLLRRGMFFAHR